MSKVSNYEDPVNKVQVNAKLSESGLTLTYESHSATYISLYNKYNSEVNIKLVEALEDALHGYQFVSVINTHYLLFRKVGS